MDCLCQVTSCVTSCVFINDLFYILEYCILYNYADDNTASHISDDVDELVCQLESKLRNTLK